MNLFHKKEDNKFINLLHNAIKSLVNIYFISKMRNKTRYNNMT